MSHVLDPQFGCHEQKKLKWQMRVNAHDVLPTNFDALAGDLLSSLLSIARNMNGRRMTVHTFSFGSFSCNGSSLLINRVVCELEIIDCILMII